MIRVLPAVRFALSKYRRAPGPAFAAVLTLALGIGVNAALFSLIDGVALRPLAIADPAHLVSLASVKEHAAADSERDTTSSFAEYQDLRTGVPAFADIAGVDHRGVALKTADGIQLLTAEVVTDSFFTFLGAKPKLPNPCPQSSWKVAAACDSLKVHSFSKPEPMSKSSQSGLPLETLVEKARETAQNSYSPYSHFRVGAALQLSNGAVVTGTNVENVSYGLTICAEAAAVARAVAEFGPSIRIQAVAITNLNNAPSPPCGACRQILSEFADPDALVAFPASDGPRVLTLRDLLPLAFDTSTK